MPPTDGKKRGLPLESAKRGELSMRYLSVVLLIFCLCSAAWAAGDDYPGLMNKGIELFGKGEFEAAAITFEKAIEKKKNAPGPYMLLGTALNKIKSYSLALEALNQAKELKTKSNALFFETGRSYLGLGKYKEAYEAFSRDMFNNPQRSASYLMAGVCLYHLGKYKEAMEYLDDAGLMDIRLLPRTRYYTGLCHVQLKEYGEAEESFEWLTRFAKERMKTVESGTPLADTIQKQLEVAEEAARLVGAPPPPPRNWYASMSMGFEYTDNVLSLSKDALLPADISDRHDEAIFMVTQAGYRLFRDEHQELWAMGSIYGNYYFDLDDFDVQQYSPQLQYIFTPNDDWQLRSTVYYTHYRIDGNQSSNSFTFSQAATRLWRADMSTTLDYTVALTEFKDDTTTANDRDGSYHSLRCFQSFLLGHSYDTTFDIGTRLGWNNTQGTQFDSDSYGFFTSIGHDFIWNSRLRYDFSYTRTKFDNRSNRAVPAFSTKRKDKAYVPSIVWLKRFARNWSTSLAFTYLDNDSNITVYDFDKYTLSGALTYTF